MTKTKFYLTYVSGVCALLTAIAGSISKDMAIFGCGLVGFVCCAVIIGIMVKEAE